MRPPSSIDGRKMAWDRRIVARESGDTTPMSVPRAANSAAPSTVHSTSAPQLAGTGAPNSGTAVTATSDAAIKAWKAIVSAGMASTAPAGTPLTRYDR
jgi:hypothetical protein